MGAKDWMVFYADQDVPSVLRDRPTLDRQATNRLVERLFPRHAVSQLEDVSLLEGDPRDGNVHAAVWPGAAIVCSEELGVDRPSTVDRRFIEAGAGRTTYLHAMHSVVDWCAFAVWEPDGQLRRALSLSPDSGIVENVGHPLPFEEPFWADDRPAIDPDDDDDEDPYPVAFNPLELGEEALGRCSGSSMTGRRASRRSTPRTSPSRHTRWRAAEVRVVRPAPLNHRRCRSARRQ